MMVLYAGEAVEEGPARAVVGAARHPYTWALVKSYPLATTSRDLRPIRGHPPDSRAIPSGCAFRCTQAEDVCTIRRPELARSGEQAVACHLGGLTVLLEAQDLSKTFGARGTAVPALRDVSIELREDEALGIIGPSGSGKSTLARIISGHLAPDQGSVLLRGEDLGRSSRQAARRFRRLIQLVMQDPWDALSPRLTVAELVQDPLEMGDVDDRQQRRSAVSEALHSVGLPDHGRFLDARTHELSGGQLQRIALARLWWYAPSSWWPTSPPACSTRRNRHDYWWSSESGRRRWGSAWCSCLMISRWCAR